MDNNLMIFENVELEILTKDDVNIDFDGKYLFSGKQICDILCYSNQNRDIERHCDADCIKLITKSNINVYKNANLKLKQRGNKFITEYGVMDLIAKSRNTARCKKEEFINWLIKLKLLSSDKIILMERKEVGFINKLEKSLKPFSIEGVRQFPVLTYKIDYYISELSIAIEYDEYGHMGYTYAQHKGRQIEIEKELGCSFIRVSDKNSDEHNIGLVFKELFKIAS